MSSFVKSREKLIDFLKSELVGPLDLKAINIDKSELDIGEFDKDYEFETTKESSKLRIQSNGEEILTHSTWQNDEKPTERYGVGVLFPKKHQMADDKISDERLDEYANEEDTESIKDSKAITKLEKIQGNKKSAKGDFDEPGDEIRSSNILNQSCMGVSFYLDLRKDSRILIYNPEGKECGLYKNKNISIEKSSQKNANRKWWFREKIKLNFEFDSNDLLNIQNDPIPPLKGELKVRDFILDCKLISRRIDDTNKRIVTAYIINRSPIKNDYDIDDECLFQSNFNIKLENKEKKILNTFLPYPKSSLIDEDIKKDEEDLEEDKSLELIFRKMKTYAVGHGCSADWTEPSKDGRVSEISVNHFPIYEAANISPDVDLGNENFLKFSMASLAGLKNEAHQDILKNLTSNYSSWISNNENKINNLEDDMKKTAEKNLNKCRETLHRIEKGIEFISSNDNALKAFQLANKAVLIQQIRTKMYKDDDRDWIYDGRLRTKKEYEEPDLLAERKNVGYWRAFQIAFILSSIESSVNGESDDREAVELIFFPTGGGKTEAYLGLIAFLSFYKRLENINHKGVDVIMRYTLRLLTTQQFTRAASLICAMEKIREEENEILGNNEFSIGVWLGQATTPNKRKKAKSILNSLLKEDSKDDEEDPFLMTKCPWCSAGMGKVEYETGKNKKGYPIKKKITMGYQPYKDTVKFQCNDSKCYYSKNNERYLPIYVIDEDVYDYKPTLLIATVDKFAQISWIPEAKSLFGLDPNGQRINDPPTLIIQDELHLITGPLGSMVGLYETVIEDLCSDKRTNKIIKPKIVCSTATIRRYAKQIKSLYNRNKTFIFPQFGLDIEDSFFGRYIYKDGKLYNPKKFIGIHATGLGSTQTAQVRTYSALLQSIMFMEEEDRDPWHTLICFFGSIKELSTTVGLLKTDIHRYLQVMQSRLKIDWNNLRQIAYKGSEILELSSRLRTEELPKSIIQLEKSHNTKGSVDVCLASNIVEVGVDIDRLSLLSVFGQPKTTSSYIQVSGRIGRRWYERPGVVVTIYGPMRPRDKSHFEKFKSYHQRLYAQVEPTSVTPFAKPVLIRGLNALMVGYVRQYGTKKNSQSPEPFPEELLNRFKVIISERIKSVDKEELVNFEKIFNDYFSEWKGWERQVYSDYSQDASAPLIYPSGSYMPKANKKTSWPIPTSLRSVDSECRTYITDLYSHHKAEELKDKLNE